MAKQTPPQYLRQHEDILSERDSAPLDPEEMNPLEINENGKRKASDGMRCAILFYESFIFLFCLYQVLTKLLTISNVSLLLKCSCMAGYQ